MYVRASDWSVWEERKGRWSDAVGISVSWVNSGIQEENGGLRVMPESGSQESGLVEVRLEVSYTGWGENEVAVVLLGVEAKGLLGCEGSEGGWCNGKVEGKSWGRGLRW